MAEITSQLFPARLRLSKKVMNKVCVRYPMLPKEYIQMILDKVGEAFQELLVMGHSITFLKLIHRAHLDIRPSNRMKMKFRRPKNLK